MSQEARRERLLVKQSTVLANPLEIELGMLEYHSKYQLQIVIYQIHIQLLSLQPQDGLIYLLKLDLRPVLAWLELIPDHIYFKALKLLKRSLQ